MVGKTHIVGGLALVSLSSLILVKTDFIDEERLILQQATLLTSAGLGALLPDIDMKGSSISRKNPIISFFARIFLTHRGFTHSPFSLLIFSVLIYWLTKILNLGIDSWIGAGLIIGYASHILLDSFNPKGVPLFYPYKKKFSFGKIVTGTWGETLIIITCSIITTISEGILLGLLKLTLFH